jgi:hypothetical protein
MLRTSVSSQHVRVEATARVVTKTPRKKAKRGYDATFQTFTSGFSSQIDSLDDTKTGRELRSEKFRQRLQKLSKVLSTNGFKPDEIADALSAANYFLTPVDPKVARRRATDLSSPGRREAVLP